MSHKNGKIQTFGLYQNGELNGEWLNKNINGDTLFYGSFIQGKLKQCSKCDTSFFGNIYIKQR